MRKFNQRERIMLAVCMALIFISGIYKSAAIINRQNDNIRSAMAAAQRKLNKNMHILESQALIDAQYKELTGLLGQASSESIEFSNIISQVEALAKVAHIHVTNIQPRQVLDQEEEGIRTFPIELDIDGQWMDLANFLYLIQASQRLYHLDELSLEKGPGTSLRGRMVIFSARLVKPAIEF